MEPDVSKQSERRGRFLIQEVEEEKKIYLSEKFLCLNKRSKHSSIMMESKIYHTTRMDSNISNSNFFSYIYDGCREQFIDFSSLWKDFSKDRCNIEEDNLDKIFNYVDVVNESNFFSNNNFSNLNISQRGTKSDEKVRKMSIHSSNRKNLTPAQNLSEKKNRKISQDGYSSNKIDNFLDLTLKLKLKSKSNEKYKGLVIKSLRDINSIFSPSFSPIAKSQIKTSNFSKNDIRFPKANLSKSDKKNFIYKSSFSITPQRYNDLQIDNRIKINYIPDSLERLKNIKMESTANIQIISNRQISEEIGSGEFGSDKMCCVCRNKFKLN
jgi:hypothetical protein